MHEHRRRAAEPESYETYGAYEFALGLALGAGYLIMQLLLRWLWLGRLLLSLAIIAGLVYGRQIELRRLYALGRRRIASLVSLRQVWIAMLWSLACAGAALWLAYARGWTQLDGWAQGPLLVMLWLGLFSLALGAQLNRGRWVYLGLGLCLAAVIVPSVPWLRQRFYLSTGLFCAALLFSSAWLGQRAYQRQLQAHWKIPES